MEALVWMPSYVKILKEIIGNKKKLEKIAAESVNEECSAILRGKLPSKSKDSRWITVPLTLGGAQQIEALCDNGASINLMPLSQFRGLNLENVEPSSMYIVLADGSVKKPLGVVEDVLVKLDDIYFPAYFVVMDMKEDPEVPIILGRGFMKKAKMGLDMDKNTLHFAENGRRVQFPLFKNANSMQEKKSARLSRWKNSLLMWRIGGNKGHHVLHDD